MRVPTPTTVEIVEGGVTYPPPGRRGDVIVETPGTPLPEQPVQPAQPTQPLFVQPTPPTPTVPAVPVVPVYPRKQARN